MVRVILRGFVVGKTPASQSGHLRNYAVLSVEFRVLSKRRERLYSRLTTHSRGRDADRSAPPAGIRTYKFPICGSCRRSAAKARSRIRVHNDSGRDPTRCVAFHALPRHRRSRTTAIQPRMPAANHRITERMQRGTQNRKSCAAVSSLRGYPGRSSWLVSLMAH